MLSIRLKTIAQFVDIDASVIDIGTDHAYIPIYLVQEGISKKVWATDVSENALNYAIKNIEEAGLEGVICTKVSDGLKNVDESFDIAILAGMGTTTIKHILQSENIPETIILQSNNDLADLREFMNQRGYTLSLEKIVFENKKYYSIMKYVLGKELLTQEEVLFGKSNDLDYFMYLKKYYDKLYEKSKQQIFYEYSQILSKFIEKIQA